jgi:hypothetical protein
MVVTTHREYLVAMKAEGSDAVHAAGVEGSVLLGTLYTVYTMSSAPLGRR